MILVEKGQLDIFTKYIQFSSNCKHGELQSLHCINASSITQFLVSNPSEHI